VSKNIVAGRPYGGTAILCRNSIASAVKLVNSNCLRITVIEINVYINNLLSSSLLPASVYMPTDPGSINADEDFEFICGCLCALVADSRASSYIFFW